MSETFLARIKIGSPISQDHGFFIWPDCREIDADADTVFTCTEINGYVECRAHGFGMLGKPIAERAYGNGSIFVSYIEYLEPLPEQGK